MIITRHGNSFLKITFADKIIAINPISKNSKQKTSKFGADIAIANIFHPDFNGFDQVKSKNKNAFVVKGAGEYEISDIFIKGYSLKQKFQGVDEMMASYTIFLDGINVAIFAPISSGEEFSNDAFEEFSKADIFVIPMGGGDAFSPKDAAKFIKQFSPKIIIPIFENGKDDIEEFSSALGSEIENSDKLTIKAKDLDEEGKFKLIVLETV